jgi:hypothetical protein
MDNSYFKSFCEIIKVCLQFYTETKKSSILVGFDYQTHTCVSLFNESLFNILKVISYMKYCISEILLSSI